MTDVSFKVLKNVVDRTGSNWKRFAQGSGATDVTINRELMHALSNDSNRLMRPICQIGYCA